MLESAELVCSFLALEAITLQKHYNTDKRDLGRQVQYLDKRHM